MIAFVRLSVILLALAALACGQRPQPTPQVKR
jgi:hypothetical protein